MNDHLSDYMISSKRMETFSIGLIVIYIPLCFVIYLETKITKVEKIYFSSLIILSIVNYFIQALRERMIRKTIIYLNETFKE